MNDSEGYDVVGRRRGTPMTQRQRGLYALGLVVVGLVLSLATSHWNWLAIGIGPALGLILAGLVWRHRG